MKRLPPTDKYLPEDGSIPERAKFTCKTCKQWFASNSGRVGHVRRFPGHIVMNVKTGAEVGTYARKMVHGLGIAQPTNGHSEISPALVEYAFTKMRETIESELDRLHDQLIPSPAPARRSKFYVAR